MNSDMDLLGRNEKDAQALLRAGRRLGKPSAEDQLRTRQMLAEKLQNLEVQGDLKSRGWRGKIFIVSLSAVFMGGAFGGWLAVHKQGLSPSSSPSRAALSDTSSIQSFLKSSEETASAATAPSIVSFAKAPIHHLIRQPSESDDTHDDTHLEEEARLLSQAAAELEKGAPRQALAFIREHARRFPKGALAGEREAERVFVLCALDRTSDAQKVATNFLHTYSDSPLRGKVVASCGGHTAP